MCPRCALSGREKSARNTASSAASWKAKDRLARFEPLTRSASPLAAASKCGRKSHRPGEQTIPCIADSDSVLRSAISPAKLGNPINRLIRTRFRRGRWTVKFILDHACGPSSDLSSDLSATAYREQTEPLFAAMGRLLRPRTAAFINVELGKSIFDWAMETDCVVHQQGRQFVAGISPESRSDNG